MLKKLNLRNTLKALGCKDIKLRWNGGPECRDLSGNFTGGGGEFVDGQLYYIVWSDFSISGRHVMFRLASPDNTCGVRSQNMWGFDEILKRNNIRLSQNVLMPRYA